MKNVVFWDVTPCGSCKSRLFGGMYRPHHQNEKISEQGTALAVTSKWNTLYEPSFRGNYRLHHQGKGISELQLLVTTTVPSSHILFTLMIEAILSSESSVLIRATPRHVPEEGVFQFDLTPWYLRISSVYFLNPNIDYPVAENPPPAEWW
jgi:hypothetical protein